MRVGNASVLQKPGGMGKSGSERFPEAALPRLSSEPSPRAVSVLLPASRERNSPTYKLQRRAYSGPHAPP